LPNKCTSPLPHTCHMPRSSHSSRFDHLNDIRWGLQNIIRLTVGISPHHPILEYPQPACPLFSSSGTKFNPLNPELNPIC
jgi:hypothetical protein